MLVEKLDLMVDRNERLILKAQLRIKIEALARRIDASAKELGTKLKQMTELEEKMKIYYAYATRQMTRQQIEGE